VSDGRRIDNAMRDLCKRALWLAVAVVLIPVWTYARASDLERRGGDPVAGRGGHGVAVGADVLIRAAVTEAS